MTEQTPIKKRHKPQIHSYRSISQISAKFGFEISVQNTKEYEYVRLEISLIHTFGFWIMRTKGWYYEYGGSV